MRQIEYIQVLYAFHFDSLPKNEHETRARFLPRSLEFSKRRNERLSATDKEALFPGLQIGQRLTQKAKVREPGGRKFPHFSFGHDLEHSPQAFIASRTLLTVGGQGRVVAGNGKFRKGQRRSRSPSRSVQPSSPPRRKGSAEFFHEAESNSILIGFLSVSVLPT